MSRVCKSQSSGLARISPASPVGRERPLIRWSRDLYTFTTADDKDENQSGSNERERQRLERVKHGIGRLSLTEPSE